MSSSPSSAESAFLGALVADAAALGLHWIYDFDHLEKLAAGESPEFRQPDAKDYEGVFSFFAHGRRTSGDLSQYGEVLLVAAESIADSPSRQLEPRRFQGRYRDHFGAGGPFVGYIDSPTRLTLENLARFDAEASEAALKAAPGLDAQVARVVVQKVIPYTRYLSGEALVAPVTRAVQVTYQEPEVLRAALAVAAAVDLKKPAASGAADEQAPAACSLAALAFQDCAEAERRASVERAVRVTNHADAAVAFALFAWDLLRALQAGTPLEQAYRAAADAADPAVRQAVQAGWDHPFGSLKQASADLGRPCYLKNAVPLALCLLKNTRSFAEAARANIRAGGDSCGRAMVLGAWAGAVYGVGGERGVPLAWLLRLKAGARVSAALTALSPAPRASL